MQGHNSESIYWVKNYFYNWLLFSILIESVQLVLGKVYFIQFDTYFLKVLVPLNLHVMLEVCPRINTVPLMDFLMARTVSFPTHQLVPRKLTGHALTSMALFGVLELAAASMLPCLLPRWTQNFWWVDLCSPFLTITASILPKTLAALDLDLKWIGPRNFVDLETVTLETGNVLKAVMIPTLRSQNKRIYPLIDFQEIFHPTHCYLSLPIY